MNRKTLIFLSTLLVAGSVAFQAQAQEAANHFKLYGFIRNYFAYDTRESMSGTGDLYYYMPKDTDWNTSDESNPNREDLNARSQFRFLSLTSRLGLDVSGYQLGNTHFGAKLETDFYAGISGVSGTAQLRLRQAYTTIQWKNLQLNNGAPASIGLKIGQAWHPMAADMPHVFSLETGAPFGPFSRTPQVTADFNLGKNWTVTLSALWQMQYQSMGPSGASANYIKYSGVPETYLGLSYKNKGFLARVGASARSTKPPVTGVSEEGLKVSVGGRLTSVLPFVYVQYVKGKLSVKAKSTFGDGGEHLNLNSGYAVVKRNDDGSWDYSPYRTSSTWFSLSYGKKLQGTLFVGYNKNLGIADCGHDLSFSSTAASSDIWFKNNVPNLLQTYRIQPAVVYNVGKLSVGLELNVTSVEYGNKEFNSRGLSKGDYHWVTNHRVQSIVKYTF